MFKTRVFRNLWPADIRSFVRMLNFILQKQYFVHAKNWMINELCWQVCTGFMLWGIVWVHMRANAISVLCTVLQTLSVAPLSMFPLCWRQTERLAGDVYCRFCCCRAFKSSAKLQLPASSHWSHLKPLALSGRMYSPKQQSLTSE